jgi:hypothetical protein
MKMPILISGIENGLTAIRTVYDVIDFSTDINARSSRHKLRVPLIRYLTPFMGTKWVIHA